MRGPKPTGNGEPAGQARRPRRGQPAGREPPGSGLAAGWSAQAPHAANRHLRDQNPAAAGPPPRARPGAVSFRPAYP